jgi:hypothetical protein
MSKGSEPVIPAGDLERALLRGSSTKESFGGVAWVGPWSGECSLTRGRAPNSPIFDHFDGQSLLCVRQRRLHAPPRRKG